MSALEIYLEKQFHTDQQQITVLESMLIDVAHTLTQVFKKKQWPYAHRTSDKKLAETKYSQGTLSMTLVAAGRLVDLCSLSDGSLASVALPKLDREALIKKWREAFHTLTNEESFTKREQVESGTFGNDNPLTLSHLVELKNSLLDSDIFPDKPLIGAISRLEKIFGSGAVSAKLLLPPKENALEYYTNAFVPLRAIRAAKELQSLGKLKKVPDFTDYRTYFESTLHDQLSFSAIPDSRFDPAELLFCLEGLLLCESNSVDKTLIEQILKVLSDKQETSAHWRPNKPFLASPTGQLMLPLSVEGANSLIRSITILNNSRLYDTFTEQAVPLLERFWRWLCARAVKFNREGISCIGWHSEHINEPNLIHIWDTSQVLDFMLAYRQLLQTHIADKTLINSGVQIREPEGSKKCKNLDEWNQTVSKKWEPVNCLVKNYKVYNRIGSEFFLPWVNGDPANYSMLLYGPPGTGKSSVAENLADALGARMITITVSDFLGLGGAMVEARVKAIFQMLEAQKSAVILFDEIDSFLLDRDSKLYGKQDTLFQFLTPGLLTKINDLRKAKNSIFIVATNYENRIDPAIKRTGRIDQRYLLLPPDGERRIDMLKKTAEDFFGPKKGEDKKQKKEREEKLKEYLSQVDENASKIIKNSNYFGFKDLEKLVKSYGLDVTQMVRSLESDKKPSLIDAYLKRHENGDENFPSDELACLIAMRKTFKSTDAIIEELPGLLGLEAVKSEPKQAKFIEEIAALVEKVRKP